MSQNQSAQSWRVLVVDDEPHIPAIAAHKFAEVGMHVVGVGSAEEALCLLRRGHFDLAIVDYHLSGADGVQLCQSMLSEPRLAQVPVLLLTGQAHALTEQHLAATNIRMILTKPFSPSELLRRATELIEEARLGEDPDSGLAAAA